ncbi:MAG: hypothetical protein DI535_23765 [Citrobacter freundii]|nr:MAG: hypothetical protein DI535_23765 [Citrobacter freundii]
MSKRPHIICLMMTSLDGKILSEKWGDSEKVKTLTKAFEEVHEIIGHKTWIVGRTTMEKDFTHYAKPVYKESNQPISREDFVADKNARSFAVTIDGQGKLGWNKGDMLGEHVITILTETVPDSYLANLQDVGVSYIFAGKDKVDLPLAMEKLRSLFKIETLMLEGGGHINGSFLNEGLIDEYHQLLLPLADGREETSSVMEIAEKDRRLNATLFKLKEVKHLENDILWLHYEVTDRV